MNDAASAVNGSLTSKTSQTLSALGVGDNFETRTTTTGQNPTTQATNTMTDAQRAQADLQGNIVWQALKRGNVGARFSGGDDELLEAIMSVTGSLIVGRAGRRTTAAIAPRSPRWPRSCRCAICCGDPAPRKPIQVGASPRR